MQGKCLSIMLRNFLATLVLTSSFHGGLNQITFLLPDIFWRRSSQCTEARCCTQRLSGRCCTPRPLLQRLPCWRTGRRFSCLSFGAVPSYMHGVVGVLVHVDGVAGCLLEGFVQACLQVEGHIQEVGYFDVYLGDNTQPPARGAQQLADHRPCTALSGPLG